MKLILLTGLRKECTQKVHHNRTAKAPIKEMISLSEALFYVSFDFCISSSIVDKTPAFLNGLGLTQ
jgi:hypothetical protein